MRLGRTPGRVRIAWMRRRVLISLCLGVLLGLFIYTILMRIRCTEIYTITKDKFSNYLGIPEDSSCYHRERPMDELAHIRRNAVYLISASCDSSLSVHHACAIESVFQAHEFEKRVYVFFNTPVKTCACSQRLIKDLKSWPTLQFVTIQIDKFVEDTPLEGVFGINFFKSGHRKQARVAEYLKLAVLYRFGGTVIDLDVIMAKPVSYLGLNWAVGVNSSQFGSAAIALTKKTAIGHSLLKRSMQLLRDQRYRPEVDAGLALTQAFVEICSKKDLGCTNFEIYDARLFYPFSKSSRSQMFAEGDLQAIPFGYYVWDPIEIRHKRDSVYVKLMREYCPYVASFCKV